LLANLVNARKYLTGRKIQNRRAVVSIYDWNAPMADFSMQNLLRLAAECNCSEVLAKEGQPPTVKMSTGGLVRLEAPKLTPEDTIRLMTSITPNPNLEEFDSDGSTEFEASIHDDHRFRISIVTEGDGVRIHAFRIQEAR